MCGGTSLPATGLQRTTKLDAQEWRFPQSFIFGQKWWIAITLDSGSVFFPAKSIETEFVQKDEDTHQNVSYRNEENNWEINVHF